jgi:cation:H+ antiporter
MIIDLLLIIIGITLLVKGSELLVDSAADIAAKAGVSIIVIGLSIVAFGTSFPELVVGVDSSISGLSGIALGNVIGSNIINICIVIGGAALIRRIKVSPEIAHKDIPLTAAIVFLLLILSIDGVLDLLDGMILLLSSILFFYYIFRRAKSEGAQNKGEEAQNTSKAPRNLMKNIVMIVIGLLMAYVGGKITVDSTVSIASGLGISSYLIAITLIAFGTNLPEIMISIVASSKDKGDLILGNGLGSVNVNTLFIIGVCAVIRPIVVTNKLDIFISLAFCLLLIPLLYRDSTLSKREGTILVLSYAAYVLYKVAAI